MDSQATTIAPARSDADAPKADLRAEVCGVRMLSERLRGEMFRLYARYYDCVDPLLFAGDLAQKETAILLWDETRRLCGFSTLAVLDIEKVLGTPGRAVYSGDTIVDHRYWGQQALAFTWIRHAGQIAAQRPGQPLYWFLIVKGHRTYRYLHVFARHYYPHPREPTPSRMQALMDRLAAHRFGPYYVQSGGVVQFPCSRGQLKREWASASDVECRRAEVSYFFQRNPGYARGDELVCLTDLHPDNLRPLARRVFEKGLEG